MPRAPYNVLVFLYREKEPGSFEYAIFLRSDLDFWQPVAGGGEEGETPLETARRETMEETGLDLGDAIFQLQTVNSVGVHHFSDSWRWGDDVYVIPQYCFAAPVLQDEIRLSHEHKDVRWLDYAEADPILKYEDNRTALWELNQRLRGKGPRG
jgi:dihydroneopterin triphosphate diphosphatase